MLDLAERNRDRRTRKLVNTLVESLEPRMLLCAVAGVTAQASALRTTIRPAAMAVKSLARTTITASPSGGSATGGVGAGACAPASVPAKASISGGSAPSDPVTGGGAAAIDARADLNHDGIIDLSDLSLVSNNWMHIATPGSLAGDVNGDGLVDLQDQALITNNWMQPIAPQTATAVAYDWHKQLINGVWNVWAPNPSDFGTTYAVTDPTALYGSDGAPQILGVHQGPIADCYFLAATGSLALHSPSRITVLISSDPNGGWAVTLQYLDNQQGRWMPVVIHTDNELSLSTQIVANNEVWSLVLEKAYAAARTWNGVTSTNTMASLAWGYAGTALQALGDPYATVTNSGYSQDALYNVMQADLTAHQQVLFHTSASAPTMVVSHVYVITGVSTDAQGVHWVTTYNPWGFYETRSEADLLQNSAGLLVIGNA